MFDREMMLTGLRKQRSLLQNLIQEIEENMIPPRFSSRKAGKLATNLKKLREIKSTYESFRRRPFEEQPASRTELRSDRKAQEWAAWAKFKGLDPQVHGPVSSAGIYADFT